MVWIMYLTWTKNPAVGLMYSRNKAAMHPAASMLVRYAESDFPVDAGPNWTVAEMTAAVDWGPHRSALSPKAISYYHKEVVNKVAGGVATIVSWDDIKWNPPKNLKVSPISMILHKSRDFRAILDLSFRISLAGFDIPSVNETMANTAPDISLLQLRCVLLMYVSSVQSWK